MQIDTLLAPQSLTVEFSLILLSLFFIIGYSGLKMHSPILNVGFAILLLVFVNIILFSISFIFFWIIALVFILLIPIVGVVKYL